MSSSIPNTTTGEHLSLCRAYGEVQQRCTRIVQGQQAEIAQLQGLVLRLRGALIVRTSAQAYEREDHDRRIARLMLRHAHPSAAADLLLCQTACLGHGDFWRAGDQCRRSGTACTLVGDGGLALEQGEPPPAMTEKAATSRSSEP